MVALAAENLLLVLIVPERCCECPDVWFRVTHGTPSLPVVLHRLGNCILSTVKHHPETALLPRWKRHLPWVHSSYISLAHTAQTSSHPGSLEGPLLPFPPPPALEYQQPSGLHSAPGTLQFTLLAGPKIFARCPCPPVPFSAWLARVALQGYPLPADHQHAAARSGPV